MTLISKLIDHFDQASEIAQTAAEEIITAQHDAESLHLTFERILELIINLAEQAYLGSNQSAELKKSLDDIDAGRLTNKINNIRQILALTEQVASVGYIELANTILVAKDDTMDYALREAYSQDPEAVKRLAEAIKRWEEK